MINTNVVIIQEPKDYDVCQFIMRWSIWQTPIFFNFNLIEILRKIRNKLIKLSFHVGECDKDASKSNRPERDWFVYITTETSMLLESDENSHNCRLHLRTALKFDKNWFLDPIRPKYENIFLNSKPASIYKHK